MLEIGCGDGKITAVLAKRVPRVYIVGIDSYGTVFVGGSNCSIRKCCREKKCDVCEL